MIALRAGDNVSEPRPVGFDDIDISVLDPNAVQAWKVVSQKVHACIKFRDEVVEWDVAGTKRIELRDLILDIRGMQKMWKKTPELVLGLGRLAQTLKQFHDFYEQLGACTSSWGTKSMFCRGVCIDTNRVVSQKIFASAMAIPQVPLL